MWLCFSLVSTSELTHEFCWSVKWHLQFTERWSVCSGSSCFSWVLRFLCMCLLYFFSPFLIWRKKATKKDLPFPLLQLVGFSTRLLYSVTTKLPFLLCHAVEKLLASKFSLSSTSALLVLLPLGSFQHGHIIPQLEAPIYFLMHFSAVQRSHSQREHHTVCIHT